MAEGRYLLVDVREPNEVAVDAYPGAVVVPLSTFDPHAIPDPKGKEGLAGVCMYDSLAVDAAGNVCVATLINGGISIVSPTGDPARFVAVPDLLTTNICFGGRDLRTAYVTASSIGHLLATEWESPGLPLNFLNR